MSSRHSPDRLSQTVGSISPNRDRKRGSTAGLGLPSPKTYRHSKGNNERRDSAVTDAGQDAFGRNACVPLDVFETGHEVKEILAVGDKVWTADRRSSSVTIRSSETGEVLKQLKPPGKSSADDSPMKAKEHIFPWSLVHVCFVTDRPNTFGSVPGVGETHSDDDEEGFGQSATLRRGNGSSGSMLSMMQNEKGAGSRKSRQPPVRKDKSGSSAKHAPPRRSGSLRKSETSTPRGHRESQPQSPPTPTKDAYYVDEVWVGYSSGCIRCFEASTGKYLFEMIEQGGIYCMCSYGEYVYSGSNDWTIRKWDATNRTVVGQFLPGDEGHSNSVRDLQIAGDFLVSASDDFTIRLWDHILVGSDSYNTTGRCLRVLRGHKASVLALAYHNGKLWSGSEDATVMVWDIHNDSAKPIKTLSDTRHVVTKLVVLEEIDRVMCCSVDNVLRVYNTESLELVSELEGHTGFVHSCAAVATILRYVVWSSSQDSTLRLWTVAGDDKTQSTSKLITDQKEGQNSFQLAMAKAKAKQAAKDIEALSSKYNSLKEDNDAAHERLRGLENDSERKDAEIARLAKLLEEERRKNAQLEKEVADKDKLQAMVTELQGELDSLQSEDLLGQLRNMKKQVDQLRSDLLAAKDASEGERSRLAMLEQENAKLKLTNKDMKEELRSVREDLDFEKTGRHNAERQITDGAGEKTLANDARTALRVENEMLSEELEYQQRDQQKMREGLKRYAMHSAMHEAYFDVAVQRAAEMEERYRKLEKLRGTVIDLQAQLNMEHLAHNKLKKVHGQLIDDHEDTKRYMQDLKKELSDALNKIRSFENQIDGMKGMTDELKRTFDETAENAHLEASLNRRSMRDEIADLQDKVRHLTDDNEQLKSDQRKLKHLESDHSNAELEIARLDEELAAAISDLENVRSKLADVQRDEAEIAKLKGLLEKARAEVADLRREEERRAELERELRDDLVHANGRVGRTEEVLNAMRAKVGGLEDAADALRAEVERLKKELEGAREERRQREHQDELDRLDSRDHYQFVLRSRTDFIQAVYDWLQMSASARRLSKRLETTKENVALGEVVENGYKRGHYILSNYVSELEKVCYFFIIIYYFWFALFVCLFCLLLLYSFIRICALHPNTAPPGLLAEPVPARPGAAEHVRVAAPRVRLLPQLHARRLRPLQRPGHHPRRRHGRRPRLPRRAQRGQQQEPPPARRPHRRELAVPVAARRAADAAQGAFVVQVACRQPAGLPQLLCCRRLPAALDEQGRVFPLAVRSCSVVAFLPITPHTHTHTQQEHQPVLHSPRRLPPCQQPGGPQALPSAELARRAQQGARRVAHAADGAAARRARTPAAPLAGVPAAEHEGVRRVRRDAHPRHHAGCRRPRRALGALGAPCDRGAAHSEADRPAVRYRGGVPGDVPQEEAATGAAEIVFKRRRRRRRRRTKKY